MHPNVVTIFRLMFDNVGVKPIIIMYHFDFYLLLYLHLFKCHCHNSRQPRSRHAVVTCLRIEYYVFTIL